MRKGLRAPEGSHYIAFLPSGIDALHTMESYSRDRSTWFFECLCMLTPGVRSYRGPHRLPVLSNLRQTKQHWDMQRGTLHVEASTISSLSPNEDLAHVRATKVGQEVTGAASARQSERWLRPFPHSHFHSSVLFSPANECHS